MTTKFFWLMMAALFLALAIKSYLVDDQFVMWLTAACAICAVLHSIGGKSEKITLEKLTRLVQPK